MNRIRIPALLLTLPLLLTACGSQSAPIDTTSADTSSAPAETTETFDVPEALDFGGRSFTILTIDEGVLYTYFEDVEAENGDVMNDAIYRRNRKVEEYLNIKFEVETVAGSTALLPRAQQDIMSSDSTFDMISTHIIRNNATLVTEGYVMDLAELEHLNFTKSWWNSSFADTMSIKGKTFFASGDMIVPNARVIVFNKQMMEDNSLPDIYETVRSGSWTLDTMGSYTKDMVRDLDGNNVLDENDQYAFSDLSNTGLGTSFVHASGQLIVEKEGTDSFRLTLQDEKMDTLLNKLYDYLYRDGNTKITNTEFGNGNVLFGSQVLLKLQVLRDSKTEFGVIPFPKYDESQDKYYSSVWNGLVCVPITAKDMDCVGAVMESLAYYSQDTLVPAYYEKLLGGKFAQDDDSVEMLDIIFDGLVYDIGFCFDNFIGCYSAIGTLLNEGNIALSSYYAANGAVYETHYQELFDSVE
ncbi:MAG: extracellular solute-binding protein [Clostridia bacterium]|nr:extracellular solute-binding protein [Clostridia bacterium]